MNEMDKTAAPDAGKLNLASAAVQFRLATIWQARGQIGRAVAGYEQAIRLEPGYLPAHLELGQALVQQGRLDDALVVYRRALALLPGEPALEARLAELTRQRETAVPRLDLAVGPGEPPTEGDAGRPHIVVYTDGAGIYGAEQWTHALALALAADGYRVTLAQPRAAHHLVDARRRAGVAHVWLADDNLYDLGRPARALTDEAEPYAILTRLRPDLVVFSDGAPMSSLAAKRVARDLGIPYLVVVHCVAEAWAEQYAPYVAALPEVYRPAQAVVAVSQANLALLRRCFGLPADQGQVILYGRPAQFFAPPDPTARATLRQAWRIPMDAVVVCTVASLERRKGYQYLLQALRRLREGRVWPHLYCIWIGRGSQEAQLRAAVERLGVQDHVRFLGERADIVAVLDATDIFALLSEYEGMPLAVMEAMARGKAVVATAVSGVAEELGATGRLLPDPTLDPAGVVAGAAETLAVWTGDAALRQAVGEACRQRAEALFTEARMVAEYRAVIARALGARV